MAGSKSSNPVSAGLSPVDVRPLTGAIGAEVSGVELGKPIEDEVFAAIHRVFLEHCMLVFPGQFLAPDGHRRFARRWGVPLVVPSLKAHQVPDYPEILRVTNMGKARAVTEFWHVDSAFMVNPPALTILAAQEMPATGGDTMWANQYRAYQTLSIGMQRLLAGLRGKFVGTLPTEKGSKSSAHPDELPEDARETIVSLHPIVRTHPETGRKSLFLGRPGESLKEFEDMSEPESAVLLQQLYAHAVRPDFVYRHRWRPGDVVMWDNRCTMHYAVHDYGDAPRNLHRITIEGDAPH